jgi:hypothetical protein
MQSENKMPAMVVALKKYDNYFIGTNTNVLTTTTIQSRAGQLCKRNTLCFSLASSQKYRRRSGHVLMEGSIRRAAGGTTTSPGKNQIIKETLKI